MYSHDRHLNLTHRKEQGILQFARIGHQRGDDEKRMAKLKEFQRPQDNWRTDMEALGINTDYNSDKGAKQKKSKTPGFKPVKFMSGVDFLNTSLHFTRGIGIKRQLPRAASNSNYLPVHMQHLNSRLNVNQSNFKALKENNFKERGFLDPMSTFNTRKDFRVDPKNKQVNSGKDGNRKKNLTFNQLLSKFGYI